MNQSANLIDRMLVRLNPGHLYRGRFCIINGEVEAMVIQKRPSVVPSWQASGHVALTSGAELKFLGTVKNMKLEGDLDQNLFLFELLNSPPSPFTDPTPDHQASEGDMIGIRPDDRKFVHPVG